MSNTTKARVEFTDLAREKVLGFLESVSDTRLAVRIHVANPSPLDPRYDITLIEHHEKCEEDVVFDDSGFEVVMDPRAQRSLTVPAAIGSRPSWKAGSKWRTRTWSRSAPSRWKALSLTGFSRRSINT